MCELICEENFGYNHHLNIWLIKNFSTSFSARILPQISFLRLRNLPLMHFWKCLHQQIFSWRLFSLRLACASRHPPFKNRTSAYRDHIFLGYHGVKAAVAAGLKTSKLIIWDQGVFLMVSAKENYFLKTLLFQKIYERFGYDMIIVRIWGFLRSNGT